MVYKLGGYYLDLNEDEFERCVLAIDYLNEHSSDKTGIFLSPNDNEGCDTLTFEEFLGFLCTSYCEVYDVDYKKFITFMEKINTKRILKCLI